MTTSLARVTAAAVLATLAACGGGGPADDLDAAVPPADAAVDAAVDLSEALFPRDRVLDVSITMAPADWDALRNQQPGPPEITCSGQSAPEAYTYFHGSITIDGVTVADVGVRKKGNLGSLSTTRPGLKIKANEYVTGQKIAGLKQLTLNNNKQDDSLISQCLGYGLFRAAGLPAPRCAFARVRLNGADLGVYSHVETIRDQFLARHFADDSGNLYESGGDFVAGGVGGFQPKSELRPPDCSDLEAVVPALAVPDGQLADRVGAVIDLPRFLRYWALEVVTSHWDGYGNNRNNYFVYHDPSADRLSFIPWGTDALFSARQRTTRPQAVYACGALTWRLYAAPATRAMYLAALRDVLDHVWDADALVAEIDRLQTLLTPYAGDPAWVERLGDIRAYVRSRAGVLRAELAAGDPVWPYPQDRSCLVSIGTLDATYSTTWGTLGNFGAGSGTIRGVIGGTDTMTSNVTAMAGLDSEGKASIQLFGRLPDGRYAVVFLSVNDPTMIRPGAITVDLRNAFALMTFYDPATDSTSGGGLMFPATITLTQGSTTAGARVSGSFTGNVIEL